MKTRRFLMHGRAALFVSATIAMVIQGCGATGSDDSSGDRRVNTTNVVKNDNPEVKKKIGDEQHSFTVVGKAAFREGISTGELLAAQSQAGSEILGTLARGALHSTLANGNTDTIQATPESSLLIGFPTRLLGESFVFGSVFTKVSDRENETLGRLKLVELDPVHVKAYVKESAAQDATSTHVLSLEGCVDECTELSNATQLFAIPIHGVAEDESEVILDIGTVAQGLSLIGLVDPEGEYTGMEEVSSEAVLADFSTSTLVFDVLTKMRPKPREVEQEGDNVAELAGPEEETKLTARWYMKLESGFNSGFSVRTPAEGVGFFGTQRNAEEKITRFDLSSNGEEAPVHYYIKNVPEEWQGYFSEAFEGWNNVTESLIGRKLISYEHVSPEDPRNELLVTGDVRFNILEWDLVNDAPYGGLGPSIASQSTGEIFSANTLIQGPNIVEIYKGWFEVAEKAEQLQAQGEPVAADQLLVAKRREISALLDAKASTPKVQVSIGELVLTVPSQQKELEDPIMADRQFYDTPEGETFDTYMRGYWGEIVTHELGHNIGLRHNFRGNLRANRFEDKESASVMEYLGRPYRHKAKIGEYDKMAVAYGYAGQLPEELNWFCTDEHVPSKDNPSMSAECSRDDAGNDPFGTFETVLKRSLDLVIARGYDHAPVWAVDDVKGEFTKAVNGMGYYATGAEEWAGKWTNFSRQGGQVVRPTEPEEVRAYVSSALTRKLCDPSIEVEIRRKETTEAAEAASANVSALRETANELLSGLELDAVTCE